MENEQVWETVYDAVRQALADERGGQDERLSRRLVEGKVQFLDGGGTVVKEVDTFALFRKVTAVREKLRVMEQKINNNGALSGTDKAELQGYLTRCYGSLTTFNFMFRDDADRFKGSGG